MPTLGDLYKQFDLSVGSTVVFDCSHDCSALWLDELEFARWKKTGEPAETVHTWAPLRFMPSHAGHWHLVVWFLDTSSMTECAAVPTYSINVQAA